MNRIEELDKLLEVFTSENLLLNIVKAMSDYEASEIFEYIKRMHDIE